MFLSKSAALTLLVATVFLNVASAIDEENCNACVDRNCGYCVVDGRESCVCNQYDFEYGYECNGGSSHFKTNASVACSEAGRIGLLIGVLVAVILVCGCGCYGCWYCFVRKDSPPEQQHAVVTATATKTGTVSPPTATATPVATPDAPGQTKEQTNKSEQAVFNA